jgi:elongation factor P--beta-lysine ligase
MKIQTNVNNLKGYKIYLKVEYAVNEFFKKRGYLKVDLPVLSPALIPESYLEVFETEFKYLDNKEKLYLTPSPELFLKRLLAYGAGDCYYLGKSFRNSDPLATLHSFEFTILEFYKMGADYMGIADEVLEMMKHINKNTNQKFKKNTIKYQGKIISLEKWEKITVAEAFEKYSDINEKELFDHQLFLKKAKEKGYKTRSFSYEDLWSQIYTAEIEHHLGKNGYPTLIYDYPKEFAALAKLNKDGKTTQRFEFYIEGIEIGDCYTELTDWKEQQQRFFEEQQKRKKDGKIIHQIDKGFIEALEHGLKPCSGIAIGFERLAMIFANVDSIDKLKLINIF